MSLSRPRLVAQVRSALTRFPVVALLGPRQVGKTTLARLVADAQTHWFDAEDPADQARLANARLSLDRLGGLVVIDEIQRLPALFPILRVLADRPDIPARFLILGSAAPELVQGASETLAGRVRFIDITGFTLDETGADEMQQLWQRGGFPRSFLAEDETASREWREQFVRTFLERDLPQLGITIPAETLRRFWTMLAHFHGQVWNAAELARSLGTGEHTVRRYLDLLAGAFVVRILPQWHANIAKRQIRSPKIYVRDSGLLHHLLQIGDRRDLLGHPRLGASWEGFVIEQILARLGTRDAYVWGTHGGAELDLLLRRPGGDIGVEIKHSDAPTVTKSMRIAQQDLELSRLIVVHAGAHAFPLDDGIDAMPLADALTALQVP